MPCLVEGSDEAHADRCLERLEHATRAACDMRTILRQDKLEHRLAPETRSWIKEHDKVDRVRIAEETRRGERAQAKQDAMDKLTMDDRRVLGL